MAESKRFYWLKLKEDFFRQKEIKKLRKIAGGEIYTIIYLKMLLRSMKDGGKLYYEGIEDNFAGELALDIDENEDNVKMTVAFLMANGILIQNREDEYELLTVNEMTGSECESAHRVRRMRAQQALSDSQNALQSNGDVTDSNVAVTARNTEIEIDIESKNKRNRKELQLQLQHGVTVADTVQAYASSNLQHMSPGNIHDMMAFMEDLPEDLIRYAIDIACGQGKPRWAYVSGILSGFIRDGIRTVGDAKSAKAAWEAKKHPDIPHEQVERDLSVEEIMRRSDDCSVPKEFTPIGGW